MLSFEAFGLSCPGSLVLVGSRRPHCRSVHWPFR
jgi:hypothetical protein